MSVFIEFLELRSKNVNNDETLKVGNGSLAFNNSSYEGF